jgi:hypothetical protein
VNNPSFFRRVDSLAVARADDDTATAERVAERAEEGLLQTKASRMVIRKRRTADLRMISYLEGQIRKVEKRLAQDAQRIAADERNVFQRSLDRAKAAVSSAAAGPLSRRDQRRREREAALGGA